MDYNILSSAVGLIILDGNEAFCMTATDIGFVDREAYLDVRTERYGRDHADLIIIDGEGFRELIGDLQDRMGVTH